MMKKGLIIVFIMLSKVVVLADNAYHYTVDLVNVKNDKISITLLPPKTTEQQVVFRFPAFVPGTYEVYNFGRFVSNFKAVDKNGNEILLEKADVNSWKFSDINKVVKITYEVNDTWDTDIKEDFVFEPGGSNIESGKNFVLNNHCFFGYFDGYKKTPFNIQVMKPKGFYGSTALIAVRNTLDKETFLVNDYVELVDSPIMFCIPDTTILTVGNAKVLVSVYCQKYKTASKVVAKSIEVVLNAQKEFLGGKLPIDKYAFIICLTTGYPLSGAYGALEHNNSSFYVLEEAKPEYLAEELKTFAAHEFFHIITPLTIHSEEIGDFRYNDPKMSRHLWMYEGVTEYFAGSVQVKYNLITQNEYLKILHNQMEGKDVYNDTLPFTKMSLGCLDTYRKEYDNVYQKGALIGLGLDIKLCELSNGKYGLQNLMQDLSKKYGKEKSFKDSELFDEITRLTYPGVREFINEYIDGNKPLPLKDMLDSIGINYIANGAVSAVSPLGGILPSYNKSEERLFISERSLKNIDSFGKTIGLNINDQLLKLNGKALDNKHMEYVLTNYYYTAKEGDYLKLLVLRNDNKGKSRKIKLKVKIVPTMIEERNQVSFSSKPSDRQLFLRKTIMSFPN